MTKGLSRRWVLGTLAGMIGAPGAALAGAPAVSIRPHLRGAAAAPKATAAAVVADGGAQGVITRFGLPGEVVCAVADAKSGRPLDAVQDQEGLPPASVAKIMTTLYALDRLGPSYRFRTRLIGTGPVEGGVLRGDLVLAGGGDPTLDTNDLAALAAELKQKGVREVRGRFLVYDGALPYVRSIDEAQHEHLGYSPAVSGIALNFNRVHFQWTRGANGYALAMDARSDRYRPDVTMARMRVVNREVPIFTYSDRKGVDDWTVASGALGKDGSRWLPVRRPADYAGDVFRTIAAAYGIALKPAEATRSLPGGTVLVSHDSEPLQEVLHDMLKFSNNLTAEMVGMTATASGGQMPGSLRESAAAMNGWAAARLGMGHTRMVDHSGLGDASRMTAGDLVTALVQARQNGALRPLLKPFPMRDAKGRVVKDHPIKVDAKTGTLNFVSGLGGFMTAPNGKELAFAIFATDPGKRERSKGVEGDIPEGARSWNRKAKQLQQKLIEHWSAVYS